MINKDIDLYEYYKMEKPQGAVGKLTLYVREFCREEPQTRFRPAMLVIPGGGYGFVSQREGEPIVLYWLSKGYDVFMLDYSVSPIAYPVQLTEATLAMSYIRDNAESLRIDNNHVCAVGFSAGSHLCASLSNISTNKEMRELFGAKVDKLRPDAVILSYGVIAYEDGHTHMGTFDVVSKGDKEMCKYLDPSAMVTDKTPPTFVWHTRNDNCVPCSNSFAYVSALEKNNVPYEFHVYQDGVHGLALATQETTYVNNQVSTWISLAESWLRNLCGFELKD